MAGDRQPHYPLAAPNPPRLSEHLAALRRLEASGVFTNHGPQARAFEADATEALFGGTGACLAVANATLGLMIALRAAAGARHRADALVLTPALTFAATAQAVLWAGMTPAIVDVDPDDWSACARAEDRLIATHGARVAVMLPYATFGAAIDLDRYAWLRARHGVGVVVDAAASLGTRDAAGRGFGAGAPFAIVHSLHATKTFAVAEGGLIHSGDVALIDTLRAMTNFGFEQGRRATLPGINAKMPEIIALMARLKLAEIEAVCTARAAAEAAYRAALPGFQLQSAAPGRRATQYMPVALPDALVPHRAAIIDALAAEGIGAATYFSPHLGEQPWIAANAMVTPTPVADALCRRLVSLPVTDTMTPDDAAHIAARFAAICAAHAAPAAVPARAAAAAVAGAIIIGGGPAGTALLTAASKRGRLEELAGAGLVLVERGQALGEGQLGRYAITSDSTADTFLSAVRDDPHPEIAALAHHPVGASIAAQADPAGRLGVPLVDAGPLVRETGARLGAIVTRAGGTVLTGHQALGATRGADGLWQVRLQRLSDGAVIAQRARAIVLATGGHQPLDRLAAQNVAGVPLATTCAHKLLQSDSVLRVGGMAQVADLLADRRAPRVVVVGGSTSAVAAVALLLKSGLPFGAGGVTLLHRRPLRPFYPSAAAALADGFTDFTEDDICPVSGFVYRLGGFRLEARALVLRMLGVGGRVPEPRLALHRIAGEEDAAAAALLEGADLVIAALGYRPAALPLSTEAGPMALAADTGGALVDRHCRVLAADGCPVPGAYGIGLAAGFVPWGPMGGEPSFRGQANGLWQWQNDVGQMIVDQLLAPAARAAA
ncbi:DegT/DnrJ/EryC1/StrS family aminotransferase [Sphingomonas sp.]|uniref:DegT/DnrJ/EryC1/StrS family aminotransferase n=1 Tax=Sphingomonas sp. TaxID=28214 RepID=UPI001DC05F0F|nr:DegT/DnrJ/EryC1/StrS family aminotransferase [Sphingomonas sp.]MBX9797192.1 DegT/DnrJ/EryC1/StrS family aminotransferase [Sphingomonas sp.]